MSEIALVSSRKFKLETAAKKGNSNAKTALELSNNPNTFLSTVQIGITLIGILTGIFSGEKLTKDLSETLLGISFLAPYANTLAVIIIVIILTYFSIVFGELIPKRIGLRYPETVASAVAKPMGILSSVAKPFVWLLGVTNDFVLGILGIKEDKNGTITEEEIKSIIQESTTHGEIQEIEQDILQRVFDLGDRKAGELMTHRSGLIWFDIKDDIFTIKQAVQKEPHSVYLVADKSLDTLVGIVSIKDLFPENLIPANFKLSDYIKKPLFVHENSPAYKVLDQFKTSRVHIAIVVDEYGSMQGILTINDVFEALVGDVIEYDQEEEFRIIQREDNSWLADGQIQYFELLAYFQITDKPEPDGFTTLAGLILHQLHHIPVTGEKLVWNNFEFEIVDMDDRRIDKVLIKRI